MKGRNSVTDYIVICEEYVPRLMQVKSMVEQVIQEYTYQGVGYLIGKRPEHLISAIHAARIINVPYAILMNCPTQKSDIANMVQTFWKQFGLAHVVICYHEGMELKIGSYKLTGVYGPQPITVVQPEALSKVMKRLLLKYPLWLETVRRLNSVRRDVDTYTHLNLQTEQF